MEIKKQSISKKSTVCSLQSAVCLTPRAVCLARRAGGFTLIELLVAMGILMIIVLMLANIFQVSARSWEVGMRQADVGLEARAAINLLQQDLARAVASSNALQQFTISGSSLSFAMFADEGSTNSAAIERVSYSGSGGLTRTLDGASSVLCEGGDFTFVAIPASAGASGLPGAVEVSLKMTSDKPFASKVRVYAEDHEYDPDNTEWADTHR